MLTNYFVKFIWLSLLTIVILADPSINDDENPSEEQSTNNSLESDPIDVQMLADETAFFYVYLINPPEKPVNVSFICEHSPCSTFDHQINPIQLTSDNYRIQINITAVRPGHDVIIFKFNDTTISDKFAFTRVRVGRGQFWAILSLFWGWGYFFIWSLSFWPQNVTNYRRKSVIGLSFDYTILHFTGFIYYSIFNCGLYFSSVIQEQYEAKIPRSEIPVELNDVVYGLHAAFTTSITFIQCFIYEKGNQRFALISKLYQATVWTIGIILIILVWFNVINWLTWIYYFSYVKLMVTSLKYMPQVYFNFRRKSTAGWTIWMIWLDITGGSFSMLQMLTIAYNYDDWRTLLGNLPKFGLGLASVLYDLIFLFQHYILYRNSTTELSSPSSSSIEKCPSIKASTISLQNSPCNFDSTTILVQAKPSSNK
ncbi:cystinosin homolog [Dermatophagoides pteronyssinus]|uniref:Cystinosin homolog n=1 Tax=Dermatophagoides pteronyssinus TaxID=6956 RepID=A0A6P6YKJ2_DERPT|nr:cystinosin homolog [Dermatophagoides pteronyssinus]